MNNKMHVRAKAVPVKHLNNVKHAKDKGVSPQQMYQDHIVESKTAIPPKTRMETFVPKPKQKSVKAVYKVKSSVNVVENKTASSPKKREKTFVPKPKQKFVKAIYKVKCSVSEKTDSVKSDNTIVPDKNQFFKFAEPNKFGFRRRSNHSDFAGHQTGEPGGVDSGHRMFNAYDW